MNLTEIQTVQKLHKFKKRASVQYGVETKRLKQQVKRNIERFPNDFMFQLTKVELINLKSQIATSSAIENSPKSQIVTLNTENHSIRSQNATLNAGTNLRSQIATSSQEVSLKSQIVTSSHGGARKLPYAFTEFCVRHSKKCKKSVIFLLAIDYLQKNQYFCRAFGN